MICVTTAANVMPARPLEENIVTLLHGILLGIGDDFGNGDTVAHRVDTDFADQIKKMVESMVETSEISTGYAMCVGNHIPWNLPPSSVKMYLDLANELAYR